MNGQGGNYVAVLRQRVEEDIAKQMGKPIHNRYHNVQVLPFINLLRYLWTCLVLDFLLVQIVIGPFTVAIWRGAWELYDDIFLVRLLYNFYSTQMDFSSELAWRGPHVCWPCLLHMWLRGQFCDCEVFKVFAKLHILR